MAIKTYTPLLSEVLKKVNNAKTKDKKVAILKEHDTEPLRMVIKSSFDPKIKWNIPEGTVPFKANEAEEGTEHTLLAKSVRYTRSIRAKMNLMTSCAGTSPCELSPVK